MRLLHIFFAVIVAALWGGNFVSAKFGLAHFSPFFLTDLRFACVAAMLLPFVARPTRAQMWGIVQLAFVLGALHLAMLFTAMYFGLDIASCAIVAQLGVPFSCLLGALFFKDRLGKWRIGGMGLAFIGMLVVTGNPNIVQHRLGFFIALAAAFCWALSNIVIKRIHGVGSMQLLGWMALFALPQLLVISLLFESGQFASLFNAPASAWASLAYTVLGSSVGGYGLWYYLLARYPVSQVAPFSLLTPVFGIAFGQLFFSDALTWQVIWGGIITIVGVAVIVIRRPRHAQLGEPV